MMIIRINIFLQSYLNLPGLAQKSVLSTIDYHKTGTGQKSGGLVISKQVTIDIATTDSI